MKLWLCHIIHFTYCDHTSSIRQKESEDCRLKRNSYTSLLLTTCFGRSKNPDADLCVVRCFEEYHTKVNSWISLVVNTVCRDKTVIQGATDLTQQLELCE